MLETYLKSQKRVRVFLEDAQGFGNQANTLALVAHLRTLGFTGDFEIIYDDHAKDKLAKLLMLTNLSLAPKRLKEQKFYLIPYSYFKQCFEQFQQLPLGLNGGQESLQYANIALMLKVDVYLNIPPYQMKFGGSEAKLWTSRAVQHEVLAATTNQTIPIEVINHGRALDLLSQVESHNNQALRAILTQQNQGKIQLQTIYGLNYEEAGTKIQRELVLLNIILTANQVQKSQAKQQKPVLLLVNHPQTEQELINIAQMIKTPKWPEQLRVSYSEKAAQKLQQAQLAKRFYLFRLEDPALAAKLKDMPADAIVLVSAGSLPKPIFDYLLIHSDLPPIIEGLNSKSLLIQYAKPYIRTTLRGQGSVDWGLDFDLTRPKVKALADAASRSLLPTIKDQELVWQDNPEQHLGNYILAAISPNSEIKQYFAKLAEKLNDPANDKLITSLTRALERSRESRLPTNHRIINEQYCNAFANRTLPFEQASTEQLDWINCHGSSLLSLAIIEERFAQAQAIIKQSKEPHHLLVQELIPPKWRFIAFDKTWAMDYANFDVKGASAILTQAIFEGYQKIQAYKKFPDKKYELKDIFPYAVALGELEAVTYMLQQSPELTKQQFNIQLGKYVYINLDWTALMIALAAQNNAMQALLLKSGATIDYGERTVIAGYGTPAQLEQYVNITEHYDALVTDSIKAGNTANFNYLMKRVEHPKVPGALLESLIIWQGDLMMAMQVLPYVEEPREIAYSRALFCTVSKSGHGAEIDNRLAKKLLELGANPNYIFPSFRGNTSIMAPAESEAMIGLLLRYGADTSFIDAGIKKTLADKVTADPLLIEYFKQHDEPYQFSYSCIVNTPEPPCYYPDGTNNVISSQDYQPEGALMAECKLPKGMQATTQYGLFNQFSNQFAFSACHSAACTAMPEFMVDVMRYYEFNARHQALVRNSLYFMLLLLTGSWLATGVAFATKTALNYGGLSQEKATTVGNLVATGVSLVGDMSGVGVTKLAVASAGSLFGSKAGLWLEKKAVKACGIAPTELELRHLRLD